MGFAKVLKKSAETVGALKPVIRLHLAESRVVPALNDKSVLRVSSLASMCPREEVLAAKCEFVREDSVDADLGLIFAHGKALHHVLQNEVLANTGALVGIWRCVECAKQFGKLEPPISTTQTLVPKPKMCDGCGCKEFLYREQYFKNEEYRVGGHPDGFLVLQGMRGLGIVECKSISSRRAWEVKQTPDIGHVIQAQCYMWLTGLSWAKILYWEKGGQGFSALFEHSIERDEDAIDGVKAMIASIWKGIEAEGALPERICATKDCPRAGKCALKNICFETE